MADYNKFQVGAVQFPLSELSERDLLFDADPALAYALDFWIFVIKAYVGARFVQAAQNAGHAELANPVAQAYPYEPLPEQLENQFQFPLFCAYRTSADTVWRSVGYETDSCGIEVRYILPPLDAAGSERILPIFPAIAKALRKKTTDGWDPAYTPPGGNPGDQWTAAAYANVEEIGFGEDRYPSRGQTRFYEIGFLQSARDKDLFFPTLTLRAYVRERDMYGSGPNQDGVAKFSGADIAWNVAAPDGTKVTGVVQVATNLPPTISGLSVTSGPSAGGTYVTISGSGFLPGPPAVYFGPSTDPQYATAVLNYSPTSLTVVTPAMQGSGVVSVTLANRDGQSATLAQSFTFV